MSTSDVWQTATDNAQADMVGRHIGRTKPTGRITAHISYTDDNGDRIVRKWDEYGAIIETKTGETNVESDF